jgi:hypothetical protein
LDTNRSTKSSNNDKMNEHTKKIMTHYNNQPLPHASVLWQNIIEEEKSILCGRQRGRTKKNGLFLTMPGAPLPRAGDSLHGNPLMLEEGWGGTNDSFLWRRERRR